MPWKTISAEEVAEKFGLDFEEVKEKHKLIEKIKKSREKQGLSQQELAELVGKSQGYIGRIERGVGTKNISFDVLLRILKTLGYDYKITTKKVSDAESLAA